MKWLSLSGSFGRVRGVDIRFHFSMLFSIPIAYYLFHPADVRETVVALLWLIGFVLCIFLHELGHALIAQLVGVEVKSIVIWILGGFTNLSRKAEKPFHNLAISAAGPLVNMLLGFFCVLLYIALSYLFLPHSRNAQVFLWGQTFINLFFSLALVNLILVVFNLLPIYPLDGGNILHSTMEMFFGRANADLITLFVSIPVLLGLVVLGIFTRDYLLLASCVLIALAVGTLNRSFLRWLNLGINYIFKRSGYYYLQGDFERALQYYTQDIEREPQQPTHYLARAACYLNILQRERAIADVERALKLAPNNALALQLRGEMYVMDKNYNAALDLFARSQEINPHWAVPYFDRGSVYLDRKEFQSALGEFNKAISLLRQFPLFYVVRSMTYFRLGNLEAAHNDQDQALRLSEKDALTMIDLNLTVYEGYLDWAEDYYARIMLKRPPSWFAYQGRADAYRVNNEHAKAITDYTRAIELMPKEPRLYLGRGKSYQAMNQLEKAAADFRQAAAVTDKLHLRKQAEELLKNIQNNLLVE
jgi:tetratricopeptide (TPR) repeat protein